MKILSALDPSKGDGEVIEPRSVSHGFFSHSQNSVFLSTFPTRLGEIEDLCKEKLSVAAFGPEESFWRWLDVRP